MAHEPSQLGHLHAVTTDRLSWLGDLTAYLPATFGALIGLRYTKQQSSRQKVLSFAGGFALGVYMGPAIAEFLTLGPKMTAAAGILTAVLGMDVIGGLVAVISQFSENPVQTGRRWINAWFGRSDQ